MIRIPSARVLVNACIPGIAIGFLVVGALPPRSYHQDVLQPYLMARALRSGADLYAPVDELSSRYLPMAGEKLPHPSPYPPIVALLSLPAAFLPFPLLPVLLLSASVLALLAIGHALGLGLRSTLMWLAWPPVWCVLYLGQIELLILAVAMLAWAAADSGRDARAGLWLGTITSIKLYPAFFLLPFLLRRRTRIVVTAVTVFGFCQMINLSIVGFSGLLRYYGEILPAVSARYVTMGLNSSPYAALLRLFGGASDVAPLFAAPQLVLPIAIIISGLALGALSRLAPRAAPLSLLVALPTVWYYYAALALPQVAALLHSNVRRLALAAMIGASIVLPLVNLVLLPLIRVLQTLGMPPPPMALLLSIQPAALVGLLILFLCSQSDSAGIDHGPTL